MLCSRTAFVGANCAVAPEMVAVLNIALLGYIHLESSVPEYTNLCIVFITGIPVHSAASRETTSPGGLSVASKTRYRNHYGY